MPRLNQSMYFAGSMVCLIVFGVLWSSAGQNASSSRQQSRRDVETRLAELPIVDFNEKDEESDSARKARNDRHNSHVSKEGARRPKLNENMESVLLDLPLSGQPAEPAFPVACDLIVTGTVRETRAYLSTDRSEVYSEASVAVEKIFKAKPHDRLQINGMLIAERAGGAVRFRSGKVLRRAQLGRNIPLKDHRYLLFLNEMADGAFSIETGYDLTTNGVVPLDGVAGSAFTQFKNYETFRNATEASLLEALRKAMH